MPRVKIDYIVSFSSEDPENQAQNLLAWDVNKKRWLCDKGEPSCSVVLQLTRAVKINAVHIGAYHAALVEVLVGRSEKPNEPFEVLVPSSVFLSPAESRRDSGAGAERVRSFAAAQLAGAGAQRWDRVRVVCSQPYNKHCKYGLSFVHIYEPEGKDATPAQPEPAQASAPAQATAPAQASAPALRFDAPSSDEDEFRPGELFAKHQRKVNSDGGGSRSTDAQIRQATSNAIKNLFDPSTKLMKTPISKTSETSRHKPASPAGDGGANRQRDSLLYTDDDQQPHAKIDHVVNRHKDEKAKKADEDLHRKKDDKHKHEKDKERKDDSRRNKDDSSNSKTRDLPKTPEARKRDGSPASHSKDKDKDRQGKDKNRKRPHSKDEDEKRVRLRAGPVSSSPHSLLRGVVFALSGYENPRRGAVRDQALAMGARYERDWGSRCTHLVCAFPNTPKLKSVRSARNGDAAVAVTAEWVEQCCARRRLLPWQWFATEPARRVPPPPDDDGGEDMAGSGGDTDDGTEHIVPPKKRRTIDGPVAPGRARRRGRLCSDDDTGDTRTRDADRSESPVHIEAEANISTESDVAFVRDERIQGNVTIDDSDSEATEVDEATEAGDAKCEADPAKLLPDFFDGYTFAIDDGAGKVFDKDLLSRYVRAYGGLVVEASHLDDDSAVDYWVCAGDAPGECATGECARGVRVRADWVWRCHEARALCPLAAYALT